MNEVYDGLKALIEAVITPPPEKIYKGWQNRTTIDPVQNYAVISILSGTRVGTNVHNYADYVDTVRTLYVHTVQVDFIGQDAVIQAAQLLSVIRDGAGVNFLANYGLTALGGTDLKAMPRITQKQWETRYIVEIEISQWIEIGLPIDDFTGVGINLENVDVHHKED